MHQSTATQPWRFRKEVAPITREPPCVGPNSGRRHRAEGPSRDYHRFLFRFFRNSAVSNSSWSLLNPLGSNPGLSSVASPPPSPRCKVLLTIFLKGFRRLWARFGSRPRLSNVGGIVGRIGLNSLKFSLTAYHPEFIILRARCEFRQFLGRMQ